MGWPCGLGTCCVGLGGVGLGLGAGVGVRVGDVEGDGDGVSRRSVTVSLALAWQLSQHRLTTWLPGLVASGIVTRAVALPFLSASNVPIRCGADSSSTVPTWLAGSPLPFTINDPPWGTEASEIDMPGVGPCGCLVLSQ